MYSEKTRLGISTSGIAKYKKDPIPRNSKNWKNTKKPELIRASWLSF